MAKHNVLLDPGHGGHDPGAIGRYLENDIQIDVEEKDVNLAVALYARKYLLQYYSDMFNVRLTRHTDKYVSLKERCEKAEDVDADLFKSIHCNSYSDQTVTGFETFYYFQDAFKFADMLQKNMGVSFVNGIGRGIKPARFYVIKYSVPNAVLFECEFLSNPEKAWWLNKLTIKRDFGLVIGETVREYFLC